MYAKYEIGERLGNGSSGTVYSGIRTRDDFPVAIKVIPKYTISNWVKLQDGQTVPKEVALLEKLRCVEGVVKLLDYYESRDSYHIVMEKHGPDLFDFISEIKFIPEDLSRKFFRQVVKAVNECHQLGVVHGDIKDENIVLNGLNVKLVDFGLGEFFTPNLEMSISTLEYCPPEFFFQGSYNVVAGTIWSLGILLYNMLTGDVPFGKVDDILQANINLDEWDFSLECKDLLLKCLKVKAEDRPTLEEVLQHKWMLL